MYGLLVCEPACAKVSAKEYYNSIIEIGTAIKNGNIPNGIDKEIIQYTDIIILRQYRIIIVVRLRSQIFRQVVQIERRRAVTRQVKFVQDDGKYASKRAAKAAAGNCAVLP